MHSVLPDIEIMSIDNININSNNPRTIRDDKFLKLIESIENFPQMLYIRPIIIDAHNNILGGNQRYLACKELKWSEVPIIRAINLSSEQYKEFILKDNYSSGEWDIDKLIDEWEDDLLKLIDIDKQLYESKLAVNNSNNEIDLNNIEDEMILKIKLPENDYKYAIRVLRDISDDINIAFMELVNGKT